MPGGALVHLIMSIKCLPVSRFTERAFGNNLPVQRIYDQYHGIDTISYSSGTGMSQDFHLDTEGNVYTVAERLSATSTATRTFVYDDNRNRPAYLDAANNHLEGEAQ